MSITVAQLIEKLQEKDQAAEVEFIVCQSDGEVLCALVGKQAKPIARFMQMFCDD